MKATIAQVQRHFVTAMSQAEVELYQVRINVGHNVDWKDGAYYAIGDKDESPCTFALYKCIVKDGTIYLGREDSCGDIVEYEPYYFVLYAGCVVVPQL